MGFTYDRATRVDPSDIVQETLVDAARKLPDYLRAQPLPFYPWLRQVAWERLIGQHRRHLHAQARAVTREQHDEMALPDHSAVQRAAQLLAGGTGPSVQMVRKERQAKVQELLCQLGPPDREVLVLRYLEQLSTSETAAVLGLTASSRASGGRLSDSATSWPIIPWGTRNGGQKGDGSLFFAEGRAVRSATAATARPSTLRDWRQSDKPSRHDAASLPAGRPSRLANAERQEFQFPVNQHKSRAVPATAISVDGSRRTKTGSGFHFTVARGPARLPR